MLASLREDELRILEEHDDLPDAPELPPAGASIFEAFVALRRGLSSDERITVAEILAYVTGIGVPDLFASWLPLIQTMDGAVRSEIARKRGD